MNDDLMIENVGIQLLHQQRILMGLGDTISLRIGNIHRWIQIADRSHDAAAILQLRPLLQLHHTTITVRYLFM